MCLHLLLCEAGDDLLVLRGVVLLSVCVQGVVGRENTGLQTSCMTVSEDTSTITRGHLDWPKEYVLCLVI